MKVWKAISVAGVAALALSAAVLTTAPSPASAGGSPWQASVDCDTGTAGVQSTCSVTAPTTLTVAIVAANNSGLPAQLGSFQFDIITDETLADPTGLPVKGAGVTGTWNCGLATDDDVDPSPTVAQARLVCFNTGVPADGPTVANGASIVLGTVQYSIPGAGTILFDIGVGDGVAVSNEVQAPLGECPEISVAMDCFDATVNAGGAAVNTATPTNTPTNTPVPTATCVGAACPTATSVAFRTVTPTPGPETPTAVPTSPPGAQPTQPGGQIPPGGGGPGGQPGGGGTGPIRLPDTGTEGAGASSPWTWVIVAAATAVAAGGAAGGVYYRRLQAQRGQAQGEE